jgi:sugar O-acyltransferase (sialic acid O-acetyltransferase NeuD family)
MRIVIVGAGGHGQVVADIIREATRHGAAERLLGYADDGRGACGTLRAGVPVLGRIAALPTMPHDAIVVAIGDNRTRARLSLELDPGETFATVRHPSAIVCADVRLGPGSMLCAGVIVNTGTTVGRGVILNTGCTVDHHTTIGDFVHIAPGVHMGGEVRVGDGAFVGIGSVVLPGMTIGEGSVVGAGAVVTRDVPPGSTVVGCPARVLSASDGHVPGGWLANVTAVDGEPAQ